MTPTVASRFAHARTFSAAADADAAAAIAALNGLVARRGGSSRFLLAADARLGVSATTGIVSGWQDYRGPGHPAAVVAGAGPALVGTGAGRRVRHDGAVAGLRFPAVATFGQPLSIVRIGTAIGDHTPVELASGASTLGLSLADNGSRPNFAHVGAVVARATGVETVPPNGNGAVAQTPRVAVHIATLDGTTLTHHAPPYARVTQAVSAGSGLADLYLGRGAAGEFNADDDCAVFVLTGALDDADAADFTAFARSEFGSRQGGAPVIYTVGHSIAFGNGLLPDFSTNLQGQLLARPAFTDFDSVNLAVGGGTISGTFGVEPYKSMVGGYVSATVAAGGQPWVLLWPATNDLASGQTGADTYTRVVALAQYLRGLGAKVVLIPELARSVGAAFETQRTALHALYDAHWAEFADAYLDRSTLPQLYAAGASDNTALFYDGTHLLTAGYVLMAPQVAPLFA
jgi:lysophospholipase L1-like esterase